MPSLSPSPSPLVMSPVFAISSPRLIHPTCLLWCLMAAVGLMFALTGHTQAAGTAVAYTAFDPATKTPAAITLQYDAKANTGGNWSKQPALQWHSHGDEVDHLRAAAYLQEAITKMTGVQAIVTSTNDLSKGIVLSTLAAASSDIQKDPAVIDSLKNNGQDAYNANEAFFIRSEKDRVLVIANTSQGLYAGVIQLLESVEYEVLGMGPDWIHTPDHTQKPLVFNLTTQGRPSYYIRSLWGTSGQVYGVGTIMDPKLLPDPADEIVSDSYSRWLIGTRMKGSSMPGFPGHALQAFHKDVIAHMIAHNTTEGFLSPKTMIGTINDRPDASEDNKGWLWIDPSPVAEDGKPAPKGPSVHLSNGKDWNAGIGWNLDLSVPFVRQFILDAMLAKAKTSFEKNPDDFLIMGMDAEDGAPGNSVLGERMQYKQWYPEYLKKENLPFGQPYVLHNYNGLNQPTETWDPNSASDNMFAAATWLLHEYDKAIDALPKEEQVTSTGKSKKDLARVSFYSYNYHDVPPGFNPDQRIRVMIASYPKHRGMGKWKDFATQQDMARAFQIMLPREPSGDYRIYSLSYYRDYGISGIPEPRDYSAQAIATNFKTSYDAGFKAMSIETDFNFGKQGLAYYLITKILWDTTLTPEQLDAIRDRWFQRSFGSAWQEAKAYYDYMLPNNYPVNGPNAWAKAIQLIDAADKKLDPAKEPAAQKRLDDLKQYWYYHFLTDAGRSNAKSKALQTYFWKGQMSYMVAMHMVMRRDFNQRSTAEVIKNFDQDITSSPAHYTHEETQAWWKEVQAAWPYTPVAMFADATLADGSKGRSVDQNDLVMVKEFQDGRSDVRYLFNSGMTPPQTFYMSAVKKGDPIGFSLSWIYKDHNKDRFYIAKDIYYGVEIWNAKTRVWDSWIDITQTFVPSKEIVGAPPRNLPLQAVNVTLEAPGPGTYRFTVTPGGNLAMLANPTFDPTTGQFGSVLGFTMNHANNGLTQEPVYFYIPKGTKTLDLEVWDSYKRKKIVLYKALPDQKPKISRTLDVDELETYTIPLEPGEDGTVARLDSNGFAFPFFYSIPIYYAKTPGALLVPRKIAEADGLTIMNQD